MLKKANDFSVNCKYPGIEDEIFHTPFLSERLDVMQMPAEWATSGMDRKSVHLLSYPFLFAPSALISYFRAINYAMMYRAFENSAEAAHVADKMTFEHSPTRPGGLRIQDRLNVAQSGFLVLEIRRDNVLVDALNQVWRRQRRELMRPLRVRMGMDEGEEGIDHGGVQQEFFRVAVAEALAPDYGTVDNMIGYSSGKLTRGARSFHNKRNNAHVLVPSSFPGTRI